MSTEDNNEDQGELAKNENSEVEKPENEVVSEEEASNENMYKDKDPKLKFFTQTEALLSVDSKAEFQDVLKRWRLFNTNTNTKKFV